MTGQNPPGPESPESGPRIPLRKLLLISALAAFVFLLATGAAGYWYLESEFDTPAEPMNQKTALFKVKSGMGLGEVARSLESGGLIGSSFLFQLQVRLRGGANQIRVGFYEFKPSLSSRQIYLALINGRVAVRLMTIPEGFNLRDIASAVERAGLGKGREILSLANDSAFISKFQIKQKSLEGYLFPDTYRFPLGVSARSILITMVQTLKKKLDSALLKEISEQNLSLHEVLTLASVIEKETSVDSERPLIAAVFLNRLKKNMRLQSDPTVIYSLPRFDGNLLRRDLTYDSPYNTYRYKGLPPGPIASPGLASIRAVLNPANVNYLYFVATRKGGHKFSRTYREHKKAVARYRRRKEKVDR